MTSQSFIFFRLQLNILLIMIIGTMILTNNNPIISQPIDDSLTFEDPLSGVQFKYTDEWVKEGSSLYGAEAECSRLPCMKLPEISVSVYPIVTEDFSLEYYINEQISYHNTSLGYTPIALNETQIGDTSAFQYVYETKPPFLMDEASNKVVNYEVYTIQGINLYKISFTAVQDEQLDKYLNSFKNIINTFTITR